MPTGQQFDEIAEQLKLSIDQLFDIEDEINDAKGIPDIIATNVWNEFTELKKHIWLDGDHVVIVGKSSTLYKIIFVKAGEKTPLFHLSKIDEDDYKLHVLRTGAWIERFFDYVIESQKNYDESHPFGGTNNNNFSPINF